MRIKVLTNLPAPYRQPIWNYLAEKHQLHIIFLLGENNWREWKIDDDRKWSFEFLNLKMWKFKEIELIPWPFGSKKILENCDLLIVSGWHTPLYALTTLLAKKHKVKIIQFYESFEGNSAFKSSTLRLLKAKILGKADRIVTISNLSESYLKRMGISDKKIHKIFNPIQYENWIENLAVHERNFERCSFLFVGQLIDRKGVEQLILAFDNLEDIDYELDIVGDGPLRNELISIAARAKKSGSIRFFGHLVGKELYKRYANNNILVLPSAEEVWGLVANEALASGMHLVVSAQCGVADFVKDMEGVTIYEDNLNGLVAAMKSATDKYRSRVKTPEISKYDCHQFARELEKLIDNIEIENSP
jgi:glycosyltransferase involved in cell wall biosynthesis